jgi:hypothetical protein
MNIARRINLISLVFIVYYSHLIRKVISRLIKKHFFIKNKKCKNSIKLKTLEFKLLLIKICLSHQLNLKMIWQLTSVLSQLPTFAVAQVKLYHLNLDYHHLALKERTFSRQLIMRAKANNSSYSFRQRVRNKN